MSVKVRIPTTLRPLTAGAPVIELAPGTVSEVLEGLENAHPGFAEKILNEDGTLRRFVNVFVDDDDVRFMAGVKTPVPDGETISIIPAVAGG